MSKRQLFSSFDLSLILDKRLEELKAEVQAMDNNTVLNSSHEDIADHLVSKFQCYPPELIEDQICIEDNEVGIDVNRGSSRMIMDRSRSYSIQGIEIKFILPYKGEGQLLHCRPSTYTYSPPHAEINNQRLILKYQTVNHDGEAIKREYERDKSEIQRYLTNIGRDVDYFNASLRERALGALRSRKEKLLKNQDLVANLGVPLRRRDDTPKTYQVAMERKIIAMPQPAQTTKPFKPEPALETTVYEEIILIISSMVHVIERSPSAFQKMKEEDLRQHFLVQLNGQFKGQATAETFNMSGKTDILIRVEDKNIFIAECKYWKGKKSLLDALTQLLSYSSWRDSKGAIIIFVRGKDFSDVLRQIPIVATEHDGFKREVNRKQTEFRFTFKNGEDPEKEVIVTILAFHLPK